MAKNMLVRIADVAALILPAVIATVLAAVYFWPKPYTLIINNFTNGGVVITSVKLDDDHVFEGSILINPKVKQEDWRNGKPEFFISYMRSTDPQLTITGQLGGQSEVKFTCELKDAKGAGCKFFATIKDNKDLMCICDSYADFLD